MVILGTRRHGTFTKVDRARFSKFAKATGSENDFQGMKTTIFDRVFVDYEIRSVFFYINLSFRAYIEAYQFLHDRNIEKVTS